MCVCVFHGVYLCVCVFHGVCLCVCVFHGVCLCVCVGFEFVCVLVVWNLWC